MISNILSNNSIWKILILYSYSQGSGFNWSDIKEYTKLQNKSLQIALEILTFNKILNKEKRIFKLNFENEVTLDIMSIIEKEKKRLNYPSYDLYIALILMLDKLQKRENIQQIYLFGSHAKKKASKDSDIDIAIITNNINLNFNNEEIDLEEKYNLKFQFHSHKFGNDPLSKEIKKDGVKII